jgi:hypothetical protein
MVTIFFAYSTVVKIIIFYWERGSCGDFVNSLLMSKPLEYQSIIENFVLTEQGRVATRLLSFFVQNFDHVPGQWRARTWSVRDCEILSQYVDILDCNTFVIPTHRLDQIEFLQSQFSNSITMGITYPKNMFPLVLKNWCKKTIPTDTAIQKFYNQPMHRYLQDKNMFGELILSEQLKFGNEFEPCVDKKFDISICLEDLYNNNLSVLESFFQDPGHVESHYNSWIHYQNYIHRYQYNLPSILHQALGYNSKSNRPGNTDCNLDTFDNILITHYCKTHTLLTHIPRFNTLQQALTFFTDSAETDNYTR